MAAVETFVRTVSFAVTLQDDFNRNGFLEGRTTVTLGGNNAAAVENPSRFYVFTGLVGATHAVRITNRFYLNRDLLVTLSALDPRNPVVSVAMKPSYAYPFPASSTLIRGIVVDAAGNAVADAVVHVDGSGVLNMSEQDGRFVLYFPPLTEDDVAVAGTRRFIKVGTSTTLQLRIDHPSFATKIVAIGTVEEASIKLVTTPILLEP